MTFRASVSGTAEGTVSHLRLSHPLTALTLLAILAIGPAGLRAQTPELTVERMPLPKPGNGPAGQMKHVSFEPGPGGRVFVYGGDYVGKPVGASYRREIWSVDFTANDWRLESKYCPPNAGTVWTRGRCQAGFAYLGKNRFLIAGGNYGLNSSSACGPSAPEQTKHGYVMGWAGEYHIPPQTPPNPERTLGGPFGQIKYGVWDRANERFLAIKAHGQIVQFKQGKWRLLPGLTGRYLWSAQGAQNLVDRRWYMVDEVAGKNGELVYMDLDHDTLHTAAPLPFPARRNARSYESVALAWWPAHNRLALYRIYDKDVLWLYKINGGFERIALPSQDRPIYGNHLVSDPAHDALVIIGGNDGAWNDPNRSYWIIR